MEQETGKPSRATWLLGGAALGALAMFMSDPNRGRRRRALTRDKLRSMAADAGSYVSVAARDFSNRMQGLRAQTRHLLEREGSAPDDPVLTARVRECLGRAVSHPGAVLVMAHDGRIALAGAVLAHEHAALLHAVRAVRGVREVEDRLDVHERPAGVPSLQGSGKQQRPRTGAARIAPATGLALTGASLLGVVGVLRRGSPRLLLTAAGVALVSGGLRSARTARAAGMQAGPQVIDLHKSIHIEAAPERVYESWCDQENFPRFMSNVKEVRDLGNGRSHWVVRGPGGVPVEWDAVTTEARRPELLAWRSEPNANVDHAGSVRFQADGGGTRVNVHLRYRPPAGMAGQAMASVFGADPRQQLNEDLQNMKRFIEQGRPPHETLRPGGQAPAILH